MRSDSGQALVEFALVLPIFAALVLAIAQLGVVFNQWVTLTDAVRAGSRTAAVARFQPDPYGVTEARLRDAAVNLDQSSLKVTISAPQGWERGAPVTVKATYPYSLSILGIAVQTGRFESATKERIE